MLPKVLWSHKSRPLTLMLDLMDGSPIPFTVRHAYHWLMCWRSVHFALNNCTETDTDSLLTRSNPQQIYLMRINIIKTQYYYNPDL